MVSNQQKLINKYKNDTTMKTMKRLSTLFLALVLTFGFTACDKSDEEVINDDPVSESAVVDEEDLEAEYDDALDLSFNAMDLQLAGTGARVASEDGRLRCAQMSKAENIITIDFGEGCEGPRGRNRKGKIIINYTGRYFEQGSVITIQFENYFVNGKQLEGTRTITNLPGTEFITHEIKLENGKITWPDGTFATREAFKTRIWKRAALPKEDEVLVYGEANGVNRRGVDYTVSVNESTPLVMKRACWSDLVFIPVKGIKVITRSERPTITIDYGDGECDRTVEVTYGEVVKDMTVE